MQRTSSAMLIASVLTSLLLVNVQAASNEHPVEKVITLLKGLSIKAEMQGKAEAVAYDKFEHWCGVSKKTLNAAIAEEKEQISMLTSQVESEEKQIEDLNKQIAKLEKELEELAASQTAADEQRTEGRSLYQKTLGDLNATIDAVGEALAGIQASKSGALAQMLSKPVLRKALAFASLDGSAPRRSAALVQELLSVAAPAPAPAMPKMRPVFKAAGDYEAHVQPYSFKSNDVIELLKGLVRKFEDERTAATKAETNAENAHALESQARTAASAAATKSKDEKTAILGDVSQDLVLHKNELQDTQDELAADTATLSETDNACAQKAQEWETRSSTRAKELEAMGIAVEILAKATGVRTEAPSNPVPPASPADAPVAFLQISDPMQRALNLLRSRAHSQHSHKLARMAQELAAHQSDPFQQVNNMIEKMIFRLMQEQTDEDNHKNWCDQELSKTNTSKINKEEKIEELTMKIDAAAATVQELATRIAECQDMVAKLTAFAAEATEIRAVGKKENAEALKDAQDAQTAVANAIAVLEAFYKDSGMVKKEAWEFVQQGKGVELPESPATWGSSYTGVADPKAQPQGIIAVLEGIAAEFAQMEAQTRAQEEQDQKEFEHSMSATDIEKAERQKETQMKEQEMKRVSDKMESHKKTRKHVSAELEAVEQYLKDLAPACFEGDSTYEGRKAARDAEIGALKEAEQILATAFDEKAQSSFLAIRRHKQK